MNTIRALVVHADNTTERIEVAETDFSTALHDAIGGWFTHVSVHSNLDFWVDDEGLLKSLPLNKVATRFYSLLGATSPIVGTAVFTGGGDGRGGTLSLDENHIQALEFAAKMANEF